MDQIRDKTSKTQKQIRMLKEKTNSDYLRKFITLLVKPPQSLEQSRV